MTILNEQNAPGSNEKTADNKAPGGGNEESDDNKGQQQNQKPQEQQASKQAFSAKEKDKS